jgi:hypothetical protein
MVSRSTAPAPGGPWTASSPALAALPSWAIGDRAWGSDLAVVDHTWLLYFAVEAAGLPAEGRCIGVATASDPTQPFVPLEQPLVCPKGSSAPRAYDRVKRRGPGMPKSGVIDPELFRDRGGELYLMYRTQGVPASIRIVALPPDGRPAGSRARSSEMVRSADAVENPTLLTRHGSYVLLTSEGYYGKCGYTTTYRRSTSLLDWSGSRRQVLMDFGKTGLCGPGGADYGGGTKNHPLLFFHAWTCSLAGQQNCPDGPDYDGSTYAQRSMFALTLRWTRRGNPRIQGYVEPGASVVVSRACREHGGQGRCRGTRGQHQSAAGEGRSGSLRHDHDWQPGRSKAGHRRGVVR